jgi:hypothetical protein
MSLAETPSEGEFEPDNMAPKVQEVKMRRAKKPRIGSLKDLEKTIDYDSCNKCRENNQIPFVLNERYKTVEREMEKLFDFLPRKSALHIPGVSSGLGCRGKNILDFLNQRQLRGCPAVGSQVSDETSRLCPNIYKQLQL